MSNLNDAEKSIMAQMEKDILDGTGVWATKETTILPPVEDEPIPVPKEPLTTAWAETDLTASEKPNPRSWEAGIWKGNQTLASTPWRPDMNKGLTPTPGGVEYPHPLRKEGGIWEPERHPHSGATYEPSFYVAKVSVPPGLLDSCPTNPYRGQTKRHSFIEALVNVVTGYVVALVSQVVIFPWFGIHVDLRTNICIGLWFTAISIVRSYTLRRLFNRGTNARTTPAT